MCGGVVSRQGEGSLGQDVGGDGGGGLHCILSLSQSESPTWASWICINDFTNTDLRSPIGKAGA